MGNGEAADGTLGTTRRLGGPGQEKARWGSRTAGAAVAISKRVVATYDIAYSFSLFRLPAAFTSSAARLLCESPNNSHLQRATDVPKRATRRDPQGGSPSVLGTAVKISRSRIGCTSEYSDSLLCAAFVAHMGRTTTGLYATRKFQVTDGRARGGDGGGISGRVHRTEIWAQHGSPAACHGENLDWEQQRGDREVYETVVIGQGWLRGVGRVWTEYGHADRKVGGGGGDSEGGRG